MTKLPVLNYWKMRNSRKSVSVLLIVLMLLSMLPTGVMAATNNAAISPDTAEYDLAAPADVETVITWNDATEVTSVVYGGTTLTDAVYSVVYIDPNTATLAILQPFIAGLTPAVGDTLAFTINFDIGVPATFTVTVVDNTPPLPPPVVNAAISPDTAEYDLAAPGDVSTTITWNDASTVTAVHHGVTELTLDTDYTLTGATLTILDAYIGGLTLAEGTVLPFTISFDVGDPATFTVTVTDIPLTGAISGTVTDGVYGVPGAIVEVLWQDTYGDWFPAAESALTDDSGNFTIIDIPSGNYLVWVSPPQGNLYLLHFAVNVDVAPGQTTTLEPIVLPLGGAITGTVTDSSGAGVKNATVVAWQDIYGDWWYAETDLNGSFTISNLPVGDYAVKVYPPPTELYLLPVTVNGVTVDQSETTELGYIILPNALTAVEEAEVAVATLTTQAEVDAAQALHDEALALVNALPDEGAKHELLSRLFAVQDAIWMAKRPVIEITYPADGVPATTTQVTVSGRVYSRLGNEVIAQAWRGLYFDEELTVTADIYGNFVFDLLWKQGTSSWQGPSVGGVPLELYGWEYIFEGNFSRGIRYMGTVAPGAVVTFRYHGYEMIGEADLLDLDGEGDFAWDAFFEVGENHFIIEAWDQHDNFAQAIRTVTVLPAPVSVTITPSATTVNTGQSVTFSATVGPSGAHQSVTWSVYSGPGTITPAGVFTSPTAGTSVIRATSTVDSTVYGQATVVVAAPAVHLPPAPAPAPTPPAPTPPTVVEQPIVVGQPTEVKLENLVTVTITAGAVTGEAPKITAQVMTEAAAAPLLAAATGAGLTAASEVVVLTMTGGEFTAPVQLTLNFDAAKIATGRVPGVFVYNERTGRWIFLGGQVVGGTITVTVDRFSKFAVFATKPLPPLTDIADHWGRGSIKTLTGMGILSGFPDGSFNPNANVTRAEFVSMLTRALGLEAKPKAAARFTDATGWAQGAIGAAAEAGLVAGYADGTFAGSRLITRAEMTVILQRVIRKGLVPVNWSVGTDFADVQVLPAWAADGISTASRAGLVRGFQDRTFRPGSATTRAEAAAMLYRLVAER
ncbi:MAG: S-layer homology domain-containing protein [Clostridium sp.]|nr:S-layer homology domain-containing protein [Clostridium sp.]